MPFDDLVPHFYPSAHWQPAFEQQQQPRKKKKKKKEPTRQKYLLEVVFS